MIWSALVTRRYRRRIAVPSFVVLVAFAAIALGWHLFANFEAHRAGYISGLLRWGKGCGVETSPSAQERLKYYQQQGNAASFTAGFAVGKKQLEKSRDAGTCRLLVDPYARASETPLLIAYPSDLSEVDWPFWLFVLLTGWLLLRSLVSIFRKPRILPPSSAMKSWRRVLCLLCLVVSVACVAAIVLQFPPDGLGNYRGYFWTDTRPETLLPTVLLGFGPLAAFIALSAPLRWIIGRAVRRERNRIGPPLDNVAVQPRRDYAREPTHQPDIVTLNVAGPPAHPGNWAHNPHHQGSGPQIIGAPRQPFVKPEEQAVMILAQRLLDAAHLNRTAQRKEYFAKWAMPPTSQLGYPRIRRDLKNRSWRGLLEAIDDDVHRVRRRWR